MSIRLQVFNANMKVRFQDSRGRASEMAKKLDSPADLDCDEMPKRRKQSRFLFGAAETCEVRRYLGPLHQDVFFRRIFNFYDCYLNFAVPPLPDSQRWKMSVVLIDWFVLQCRRFILAGFLIDRLLRRLPKFHMVYCFSAYLVNATAPIWLE